LLTRSTKWEKTDNMESIETERLRLRNYQETDLLDLLEYLSDEEVVRFEPYLPMNLSQVQKVLSERMASEAFIAVEEKNTGKLIGNLYFDKQDNGIAELGYVLNKSYWQKGYGYEACKCICTKAFEQGIVRIEAYCDPLNTASYRLLEKLGFVREQHLLNNIYFWKDENGNPIWKDTYVYALEK